MVELTTSLPFASSLASLESLLREPEVAKPEEKFLRFRLDAEHTVLVPVKEVLTVLTVAVSEVLPVPQMSSAVLGIYNYRGEALWLVDAANQMGFQPFSTQPLKMLSVIVVQSGSKSLGLVVSEVQDIEGYDPEELIRATPEVFSARLLPFVKGYFPHEHTIVLELSSLVNDSNLQIHKLNQL
jgi:positive phototaxis protein PixI